MTFHFVSWLCEPVICSTFSLYPSRLIISGAGFLFADGSTRFINDAIDELVLDNLSTRNGYEIGTDH